MTDDAVDLKCEIDKAATHLLTIITASDAKTSIKERVDAFNAIVKWHELSVKMVPAEDPKPQTKKDAPIDKLKRQFNGTPKRGARADKATQ